MKVGSTDYEIGSESERGSVLAHFALRLKSLETRFPSMSQSLLSILDQAIVSGTSFVSAVIIGRLTTPDDLGLYYLVLSIVVVAAAVQDNTVSAPYLVYCKRRQGRELDEYSGSVWLQLLVFCALSVLVLLTSIAILSTTTPTTMLPGLWALLGAAPLILLRQGARRFAFANLRVKTSIVLDAVVAAVQLGGLVLIGYFGHLSVAGIFAVMGGACAFACVVAYWLDPPRFQFVRTRYLSDWRNNWAFSKWTLRSYLVGYTAPFVLLWILGLTAGAAAAGVLGVCSTLVGMANVLLMGVDNVLTPQAAHAFATDGARGLRYVLFRTAAFLLVTLSGFFLFLLATGDWLAILAFGAAGEGTGAILAALALSAVMNSIGIVAGNGLWAIDQPRPNFLADIICLVATLLAAAFLVVPLGALGAALATLAGMAAAAIVRTITLVHYLRRFAAGQGDSLLRDEVVDKLDKMPDVVVDASRIAGSRFLVDAVEAVS